MKRCADVTNKDAESVWDRLSRENKPVVIYGTGNGADKIIDALKVRGITPDAVFASSGFVRDRTFRSLKVESFESVTERLGEDINVLLAFGTTRSEVIENIDRVAARTNLFIPEVPLYGEGIFDRAYLEAHESEIARARALFEGESQKLFDDAVMFRLTAKREFLARCQEPRETYLELSEIKKIETVCDLGAFRGDTLEIFAALPDVKTVVCLEPDPKSFIKLCEKANSIPDKEVIPLCLAASDRCDVAPYSASGSRGAGEMGKNKRAKIKEITLSTLDKALTDARVGKVDLIKLDVEGDELPALKGAASTISSSHPALAVSLYHRTEDFFTLPLYLHETYPYLTNFTLKRPPCLPMWDLMLIAW